MNVTSDHFLKPSGSCLINKSNLMYVIIVFGFFSFSAAVCVQQYDEQFVHLFNLTMTQLKQVWINNKIDKSCSCNKFLIFEKLDLCFFSWWQYCKIIMYCVDAAFGNKFERGLPERDRWWTKVYSELESVSVYIPEGTWPADWEEARLAHCPIRG